MPGAGAGAGGRGDGAGAGGTVPAGLRAPAGAPFTPSRPVASASSAGRVRRRPPGAVPGADRP
ncbi:hypothetical protein Sfr7A_24655 [Streptomyces xinghaiensis]|uniref:Uncharacterized protein n=1 Tax=Streptomyces xinghaiensis TaxID=1038928 RepID=A0A420V3U4_9ACTN|nr:hypothetical protein Sfr7A_24655 [Streptomyces xinghaiensis]RKM95877.1 hypothetical protein SFRA_012665 [Streptomyces xinghaiensis]RNC70857.1 hypothetical protein DC095_024440 [Streptomyces xinghaiensis]